MNTLPALEVTSVKTDPPLEVMTEKTLPASEPAWPPAEVMSLPMELRAERGSSAVDKTDQVSEDSSQTGERSSPRRGTHHA